MCRELLFERLIQERSESLLEVCSHRRLTLPSLAQTLELLAWLQLMRRVGGVPQSAPRAVNRLQVRHHLGPKLLLLCFQQPLGAGLVRGRQMAHVLVEALTGQYMVENH